MEQAASPTAHIQVAVRDAFALVKVTGRATFKQASSLKRFCSSALESGSREIIFDMEACSGMDSTFMGVLAGISIYPVSGVRVRRVVVLNLTPRTHSMLSLLGLERVLECHESDDSPPELRQRLANVLSLEALDEGTAEDRRLSLTTMLQAHQHLVDVAPENRVRFRDVLTYLDQEIRRHDEFS